jgi:hypothetical protein
VVLAVAGVVVSLLSVVGAALALLGFWSPVVPRAEVAAGISTQLAGRGIPATAVDCPQDLPAKVGESVRCTYTVDGRPVGVTAQVSSVQGDEAVFDINSEAPLVLAEDVASEVDEYVATLGYPTDGPTHCPGTLIGEIGRSVRCEFAVGRQPVDAVATVSSVAAEQAVFDITLEARPRTEELVEEDVAYTMTKDYGVVVDTVDCDGGLSPVIGESVFCTVAGGGEWYDLWVAVVGVSDGLIVYELQSA